MTHTSSARRSSFNERRNHRAHKTVMERIVDRSCTWCATPATTRHRDAGRRRRQAETGTLTLSAPPGRQRGHRDRRRRRRSNEEKFSTRRATRSGPASSAGRSRPDLLPGFSTVEQVSDVPAAGSAWCARISGPRQQRRDFPNPGARFTVRLPLRSPSWMASRCGRRHYIAAGVDHRLTIVKNIPTMANGGEVFKFRDEYLPLMRLYDLYGATPAPPTSARA